MYFAAATNLAQGPLALEVHASTLASRKAWPSADQVAGSEGSMPLDPEQAQATCEELIRLLGDDDADSIELLRQHTASFKQLLPELFDNLQVAVNGYDFEAALEMLQRVRSQWAALG